LAQVLEHGVVNLLSVTDSMRQASSQEEYDLLVAENFKKTLGYLAKKLGSLLEADPEFLTDLQSAVKSRNFLTHHYWRRRIQLTVTTRGRNRIIEELQRLQQEFESLDRRMGDLVFRYGQVTGVTRDRVSEFIQDERETLTALDGYLPDELPDLRRS
jgi:hypothetical protein